MTTLLAFVFVLGVLVFVHELGHFLAAKRVGIRVLKFQLGFNPTVRQLPPRRHRIQHRRAAARRLREDGRREPRRSTRTGRGPDEFLSKTKWERFQVLIMGPVMNIALALVLTARRRSIRASKRARTKISRRWSAWWPPTRSPRARTSSRAIASCRWRGARSTRGSSSSSRSGPSRTARSRSASCATAWSRSARSRRRWSARTASSSATSACCPTCIRSSGRCSRAAPPRRRASRPATSCSRSTDSRSRSPTT